MNQPYDFSLSFFLSLLFFFFFFFFIQDRETSVFEFLAVQGPPFREEEK